MKKVLGILLFVASDLGAQVVISGKVTISGLVVPSFPTPVVSIVSSSTSGILRYTAPSTNACTIELSESASYTPLSIDVDTTKITSSPAANLDSRAGSLGAGTTSRVFVAGSQTVVLGADAATYYSRALQAYTAHYYRITCDAATFATGSFMTANIPVGGTYNAPPLANPASLGDWLLPTRTTSRTQTIADPWTGALLSPVSLPADHSPVDSPGVELYDGAQVHPFNSTMRSDGTNSGYVMNLSNQIGFHIAYWLNPTTGINKYLGILSSAQQSSSLDDNGQAFATVSSTTTRYSYTGAYAAATGTNPAAFDGGTTFSSTDIGDLINAFDSTYDKTKYTCGQLYASASADYSAIRCIRTSQDSYGWLAVFYKGDGRLPTPATCSGGDTACPRIIAAWNGYAAQAAKFCAPHEYKLIFDNAFYVNWHGLNRGATALGLAGVETTLASGASSGATTITVVGAPVNMASGGDSVATPAVTVGDRFRVVGDEQTIRVITGKASNVWTFTPALSSNVSSGAVVYMSCNATPGSDDVWATSYWKFLDDPHATDTGGTYIVHDTHFPGGGHDDWEVYGSGQFVRVAETTVGWGYWIGNGFSSLNQDGILISAFPTYNGAGNGGGGTTLVKHPSIQHKNATASANRYFFDRVGFNGGDCCSASGGYFHSAAPASAVTAISGNLYQYFSDATYPLKRKLMATQPSTGGKSLLDISSAATGNQLGTGAGDNYKYCVAHRANECRTGSAAGDIYFNVPALDSLWCKAHNGPYPPDRDICITNTPAYSGSILQIGMGADSLGSQLLTRSLSTGIAGPKVVYDFPMAKASPLGEYALFTIGAIYSPYTIDTWKLKMLPMPTPDGYDRTKYIPVSVPVSAGSQNNVVVKFWYVDTGYCGTRAEDCYATAATVPTGDNPYFYPVDGTSQTLATLAGLSCGSGCTVMLPGISGKVIYYAVVRRDASNAILSTDATGVQAVP